MNEHPLLNRGYFKLFDLVNEIFFSARGAHGILRKRSGRGRLLTDLAYSSNVVGAQYFFNNARAENKATTSKQT